MEAALSNFTTIIISFGVIMLTSYIAITLIVHKGLKSTIPSREIRNAIIKISSVVVFGIAGMLLTKAL